MNTSPINRLLNPKSIAIIGASEKKGALGNSVMMNLIRNDYKGEIYLVNPKRDNIDGKTCLSAVDELPFGVDVAVLAIPRPAVLETIRGLAARKIGAVIIFSAGFAEGGEEGLKEQQEIARIAHENNMLVEGPNCLGCVNYIDAIPLTFVETNVKKATHTKHIGIVSQSGAMAAVLGTTIVSRDIGISYSVSTGNEAASGVEDYVEFLLEDKNTQVIAMIVEQFRNPKRFLQIADRARLLGKKIILLHPGQSSAARESAATHTGAMAGDYQLMKTKTGAKGVIFAHTLEELADIAEIEIRSERTPSGGTVVFGESGAFKALMLDFCEEIGVDLPTIDDENAPNLRAALPPFVGVSNPLDLTAQGLVEPDLYYRVLEAVFNDDRFGTVVLGIIQTDPITCSIKIPPILRAMRELKPAKPVIFAGLDEGADIPNEYINELRECGISYFPSTERVFRAIKRCNDFSQNNYEIYHENVISFDLSKYGKTIAEYEAKQILSQIGITFPNGYFAKNIEEALKGASKIGYPIVIKAQSPDLSHKSDAGGVILNIKNDDELKSSWQMLYDNVKNYNENIVLDGVLLENMSRIENEIIVGGKNDEDWGAVVLVGFGGVTAEIFKDTRLIRPDAPIEVIVNEINKLKSSQLLNGFRGAKKLDTIELARLVAKVGSFLLKNPQVKELDLNPVVLNQNGLVVLDALIYK